RCPSCDEGLSHTYRKSEPWRLRRATRNGQDSLVLSSSNPVTVDQTLLPAFRTDPLELQSRAFAYVNDVQPKLSPLTEHLWPIVHHGEHVVLALDVLLVEFPLDHRVLALVVGL